MRNQHYRMLPPSGYLSSVDTKKIVCMVLVLNGIPAFTFKLKKQSTDQTVDDAKRQWMYTTSYGNYASSSISVFWTISA